MEIGDIWRDLPALTGGEKLFLRQPTTLQEQLLLLHAQRNLLARGLVLKNSQHCLTVLPGSFAAGSLKLQYLMANRRTASVLEELPDWQRLLEEWTALVYSPEDEGEVEEELLSRVTELPSLGSQEMLVGLAQCKAEELLQRIVDRQLKLADIERINFQTDPQLKLAYSPTKLLAFLNALLPKSLFAAVVQGSNLPLPLAGQQQLECIYSNRAVELTVRQSPRFSALLRVLFRMLIGRLRLLSAGEERSLMQAAFRYYFLHYHSKTNAAVELLIGCFNAISDPVRFAMAEEFVLFLHMARKIGREKLVGLLLEKSAWLREIDLKTGRKKCMGYKLGSIDPFTTFLPERLNVPRSSTLRRYFECLDCHSLLFLRVGVRDLDITIRITLQGDLIETTEVPFVPVVFEKVKELRETLIFPQRGVYCMEFDNSYSWVNAKDIEYEHILLTPLSYATSSNFPFSQAYYLNLPMTQVTPNYLIDLDATSAARVNVRKSDNIFSFIVEENGLESYQYETDNLERFLEKLGQLKGRNYYFCVISEAGTKAVKGAEGVARELRGEPAEEKVIEMIELEY